MLGTQRFTHRTVLVCCAALAWSCASPSHSQPQPSSVDAPQTTPNPDASGTPATMQDYMDGRASFVFDHRSLTPLVATGTWGSWNIDHSIQVVDGVWYMFHREPVFTNPACTLDQSRTVVRSSTDKGLTWSAPVEVVGHVLGTWTECNAADGDAFFDAASATWHFVYQCGNKTSSQGWAICHSSLQGHSPMARFVDDPAPIMHGVGTPDVLGRYSDGRVYVSYHKTMAGGTSVRGMLRTFDFHTWSDLGSIVTPADCTMWHVPWAAGGCIGLGAAGSVREGDATYMVVEGTDKSLACTSGQNWVNGFYRLGGVPSSGGWQLVSPDIPVFNSHEIPPGMTTWPGCGIQYPQLFSDDSDGSTYFVMARGGLVPHDEHDPVIGHSFYRLELGAPVADYRFREQNARHTTWSDVISRGDLEATLSNITRVPLDAERNALVFDGQSSQFAVSSPTFAVDDHFRLVLDAQLDALPGATSALLAGKKFSYYLELYQNGQLCGHVLDQATGSPHTVCTDAMGLLGTPHVYELRLQDGELSLCVDGQCHSTSVAGLHVRPIDVPLQMGALAPDHGYFASFRGVVRELTFYK